MEKLFTDGVLADGKRQELMAHSEYFVRDILRRFRPQQEDGVPVNDIERVANQIASSIAQLLWEQQ